jgi:hypothetical protein
MGWANDPIIGILDSTTASVIGYLGVERAYYQFAGEIPCYRCLQLRVLLNFRETAMASVSLRMGGTRIKIRRSA